MPGSKEIEYAIAHTRVLYVPDRRIDTFGDTRFSYHLLSECMDEIGVCRIRSGWVEATRPRIVRPSDLSGVEMSGFSTDAAQFFDWMKAHGRSLPPMFRYGFQFSRSDVSVEQVHDDIRNLSDRVVRDALESGDSLRAVISGVDDLWEFSLLRFMMEMIQESHETNIFDFRRRGML